MSCCKNFLHGINVFFLLGDICGFEAENLPEGQKNTHFTQISVQHIGLQSFFSFSHGCGPSLQGHFDDFDDKKKNILIFEEP